LEVGGRRRRRKGLVARERDRRIEYGWRKEEKEAGINCWKT